MTPNIVNFRRKNYAFIAIKVIWQKMNFSNNHDNREVLPPSVGSNSSWKDCPFYCVGIQKHFMGAEILGFGLPNRFFGLTMSCFFRDGIVN
jgi:hypothetical protein